MARVEPLRVGIYARISTHDQQTLPLQVKALRQYARRRSWKVVKAVEDVSSGASERPQREELIKAARRRQIDAILVWRLDRWGRSLLDLIVGLAISFALPAFAQQTNTPDPQLRQVIDALAKKLDEAFNNNDAAAAAALFTEDGVCDSARTDLRSGVHREVLRRPVPESALQQLYQQERSKFPSRYRNGWQ